MSHYATIVSAFSDKNALVAALKRCGIGEKHMSITDTTIMVSKDTGTYLPTKFYLETAEQKGRVECDPYAWPSRLQGVNGEVNMQSWLDKVRMEYDAEVELGRAQDLGQNAVRLEQEGKIYIVIQA